MNILDLLFNHVPAKKEKRQRKPHKNKGFQKALEKGYKVYDAYYQSFRWGYNNQLTLDHYMKLSILSKKPLNKVDFRYMYPGIMGDYLGVVYNPKARYCKYITENGKSIDRFSNTTGKRYHIRLDNVEGTKVEKFYITEY